MIKKLLPRTVGMFGMLCPPLEVGPTWIEGEGIQNDYGQFQRRGVVRHAATNALVPVWGDIADTYFSIPAATQKEGGVIMVVDAGEYGSYLEFTPSYRPNDLGLKLPVSAAYLKKQTRKAYKT